MPQQPSNKTVLVTGATGLLGREVVKAFESDDWIVVGTGLSRARPPQIRKLDLQDTPSLVALLDEVKPRVIVHCAAERRPDHCQTSPTSVTALNTDLPRTLSSLAQSRHILLLYISTDYVFRGAPGEAPYAVNAAPSPTNFYGETKRGGEEGVLANGGVVFRVPVLYGDTSEEVGGTGERESAVNVLMGVVWDREGKAKAMEKTKVDHWAQRYPTNTEDVARVLKDVANKYTTHPDPASLPRILHFTAEEQFTKYEICKVLGEIAGLPVDHIEANEEGDDPNSAVVRPYDCHLDTSVLKELGISVHTVPFRIWWQRYMRAYKH